MDKIFLIIIKAEFLNFCINLKLNENHYKGVFRCIKLLFKFLSNKIPSFDN